MLSTYFLGQKSVHLTASLLVMTGAWLSAYILSSKFVKPTNILISILSGLIILECPAIYFFYFIRPYTLYFSVIIFLNLFAFGILSGTAGSVILYLDKRKQPEISYHWLIITVIILISAVHLIPFKSYIPVLPFLIALGYLSLISWQLISMNLKLMSMLFPLSILVIELGLYPFYPELRFYESQKDFEDKVVYATTSENYDITVTQWMHDYWLYLNKLKNLSTIDEFLYYEPFAHTAANLSHPEKVLILGGENGCLLRELLKYKSINEIDIVPYDTTLLWVCRSFHPLIKMNRNSFDDNRVRILNVPVLTYITGQNEMKSVEMDSHHDYKKKFDLIAADLPDPRDLEKNQFYTLDFYNYLKKLLNPQGIMITQAGSPYFATKAFLSIEETIRSSGFHILPIHNQILTLGEWSWIIASMNRSGLELKEDLMHADFSEIKTRWLNKEALLLLTSFGKDYIKTDSIEINTLENPVVYKYYLEGNWELD